MPAIAEKIERRNLPATELRVETEDDNPKIVGYSALFNSLSENLGGFREKIAPNAFKRSLETGADVRALMNHDSNYVLGRNTSGTLQLNEDDRGLKINVDPPDTTWAKDLMTSMKRGDISQMSFGFMVNRDRWETVDGEEIRTLEEVELMDVSVVTYPAYQQTSANVRSIFNDVGIDFEALSSVVTRSKRGLQLTDTDRDLIKSSVGVLNDLAGVVQENPPAKQERQEPSIAMKEKELQIIESELI
jgi:HK97 family phage prohead protease